MGDSFRVERRVCATPGCRTLIVCFTDAESVATAGEADGATCAQCLAAIAREVEEHRIA